MNLLHDVVVVDSSLVVSSGDTTPVSMKKEILKMFNNNSMSSNSNSGITAGFFDSNYTEEDYPLPPANSSSASSKSSSGSSRNDHFLHAVIGGGNDAIAATSSNFRVDDTATAAAVGDDEHMTMVAVPIPPGQTIVQKPNPKDVLCGRGGRINSHPGNVYFRTLVEQYKHKYCDPGTKNVDKARMASSIVYNIRNSSSSSSSSDAVVVGGGGGGRFLKEDQDSGYWVEIGDEKAIRKAAQALREMAPVLRHQTPPRADGKGKGGRGKADPPGPRHRPGPPKREGLMNNSSNERRNKNRSPAAATTSSTNAAVLPDDKILDRMRNEIRKMELLQAEQTRKLQFLQDMELYEIQRSRGQCEGSSSRGSNRVQTITNDNSNHSLHSSIEELGLTAREAIAALPLPPTKQHSVQSSGSGSGSSQSSHQEWDIQAEYLKMQSLLIQRNQLAEKLSAQQLKASSKCSSNERRRGTAALRQKDQQQQWERNHYMQNKHHDLTSSSSSSIRISKPFNRQYSSNLGGDDHTMYTLSSTGSATKSIDMSSLGGFTWNMWNNTSANSNTINNNNNNSSGEERNIAMAASNSRTSCNSTLSSLEYKLENARQMQRMQQQQLQQNQQQRQQQKDLTASMNSLGIDDDESFRVSNMEFSEMDMSCFSNTTTTDHPSNSYSNMLQEYSHGNKGNAATSSRTNFRNHPTNNNTYTKARQHGSSMVDDDDLLNASLKSLEISDNNFVGSSKGHDNMGTDNSNNHEQNIYYQQQQQQQLHQQHQQPGVNQHVCQQHSSSSVHNDMGISDVDFGISISSLKSIDVEYDDWLTSQQTKGMESINELVNPWETEDDNDAAAAAAAANNRRVRMMYASEAA